MSADDGLKDALALALTSCARETGILLKTMQAMPRTVEEKSPSNLVTDADRAAEALIVERLSVPFPGARFLLEEGGEQEAPGQGFAEVRFIVDPLDGTTNFASRIPHFAVSIAAEVHDLLTAAAIYDPWREELFWAVRGRGAYLTDTLHPTGQALEVSSTERLKDSVVATGFPYTRFHDADDNGPEFCALNLSTRGCRRNGAATLDLAWVAAGRFEAYWEKGLAPWDVAAGALIVDEAGGRTSNYRGQTCEPMTGEVVASNGHVHTRLLDIMQRARSAATPHLH